MPSFTCQSCNKEFSLPAATLAKYPNWTPKECMDCKKPGKRGAAREENLTLKEVLEKYTSGPADGVFCDGAASPNPGPGGWGAVYVKDGNVIGQDHGHEKQSTNNKMELLALKAAINLVPIGTKAIIYSDSQLCVKTFNEWAAQWELKGWKRKTGPIKNLELVQEIYEILRRRTELKLQWIAAHSGNRWNEYADSLATAYRREEL
jgi:ribonuclease HI